MKKVIILCLLLFLIVPITILAKKKPFGNGLYWELSDNGVLIISGNGDIPNFAAYKHSSDYKKLGLAPWNKKSLWDKIYYVVIEEGVTSIGNNAFNGYVYSGSTGLTKIKDFKLPSKLKSVGYRAFAYSAITSFDLEKLSHATLGECIFWHCNNLTAITIPSSWIRITNSLFYRCDNLVNVSIPEGIKEIGANAFTCCLSLRSIKLPQSLKKIGRNAFSMTPLQSISFPEKLEEIGDEAFWSCKSLTEVRFPSSLKTIGQKAFSSCENLESISMNDGVLQIGDFAFVGCKKLTRIRLSSNAQVGKSIFNSSDWEYPRFRWRFDGTIYGLPTSFNEDNCYNTFGITKEAFRRFKNGDNGLFNRQGELILEAKVGRKVVQREDEYNSSIYYEVTDGDGHGILGENGKWIVPVVSGRKVSRIHVGKNNFVYYKVSDKTGEGIVSEKGKILIPTSRGYTHIGNYNTNSRTFAFAKKGYTGVCNEHGDEISLTKLPPTGDDIKAAGNYGSTMEMKNGSSKYYKVSKNGRYGLTDAEGKIIVPVEMEALESAGTGYLRYKLNGFWGLMNYQGKVLIDTNRGYTSIGDYKSFNKRFAYTMNGYKGECDATGRQISKIKVETPKQNTSVASSSSSSSSSSSTSSSSGNNSSGNKTTTVVVEHHRDPVPVQVWKQCTICFGSGKCQTCGGTGIFTGWSGNSSICEYGCGGSGKCSFCAGHGGHYEVEYR